MDIFSILGAICKRPLDMQSPFSLFLWQRNAQFQSKVDPLNTNQNSFRINIFDILDAFVLKAIQNQLEVDVHIKCEGTELSQSIMVLFGKTANNQFTLLFILFESLDVL